MRCPECGVYKGVLERHHTECPKCGENSWDGPKYVPKMQIGLSYGKEVVSGPDYLSYTCQQCGYTRLEPCLDAE